MVVFSSDYGSGSSTLSSSTWLCAEKPHYMPHPKRNLNWNSPSYLDLAIQKGRWDDVMRDFEMNGIDSPYNPDEDNTRARQPGELSGLGPGAVYVRQKSWPAPERTPGPRLQRPHSLHEPQWIRDSELKFANSTPALENIAPLPFVPEVGGTLTEEQAHVLHSLPNGILFALLRTLRTQYRNKLQQECRFCKNNGERQTFYRSHVLKDGLGRVSCPVLRAFTCRRCGARGDHAHTIKYCPFSTNEERIQSKGIMRSIRVASGRRRPTLLPPAAEMSNYVVFEEPEPSVGSDGNVFNYCGELDPKWAALEQKLSMY